MLKVDKLSKSFNGAAGKVIAVDGISMQVLDGQFVSVVGRSGSGKTTLLSLLGALEKPTSGSIKVGDQDITVLGDRALIQYRAKQIGFIFQGYNLVPNLTALENVMLPMEFAKIPKDQRQPRAEELLDQVGISDDKQLRRPTRLSGGE